ncbi:ubiquitin-like modifier-activating enzyme ATG7 isoform X2 [Ochlerotatus camptorhynchus]|uniref:ubiquitin-like modifier-activating enzyme ATG7 isoform X2 n=1 Tax=Ochlerotatus camptorhynchus TaxID=644619 RepID=UPI0031D53F62
MESGKERQLKFVPPKSFVHQSFWYKLADIKLNIDKLQDSPKEVYAEKNYTEYSRLLIEVDCTAFNRELSTSSKNSKCKGILLNTNTIEEFRSKDKNDLIKRLSDDYFNQLLSKDKLESSSELFFFLLFSFADFKAHKYYYWFAFPAFRDIIYKCRSECKSVSSIFSQDLLEKFELQLCTFRNKFSEPVFIFDSKSDIILKLSDLIHHDKKDENFKDLDLTSTYICCDDRSVDQNPCWLLRQLLGYLVYVCPLLANKEIKCICLRQKLQTSVVLLIIIPSTETNIEHILWTGWEANKNGKLVPQLADMSKVMDPEILAEKSISLNLTLMKWRLLPSLNIEIINQMKYLLLGAGTLGCGVARSLLAWGAQYISFVDCGKVSLSNPVRQSLYLYEDAIDGGKPKALTAAKRLKQINPCVLSTGHWLKIPMPGHPVGESQFTETNEALENLENLIKEHDVIFLLTDSRESRWLPTMLAAYHEKL